MKTVHILLLCILAASTVVCNSQLGPQDCCFTYYPRRMKKDLIQSYFLTDVRCHKSGVVFVTTQSRRVCVDPNLSWVKGIMRYLDERAFDGDF